MNSACPRTMHFNDNPPLVGPAGFKRLNPRKLNCESPPATKFTCKVTTPIHLNKDTRTHVAKACGKVSVEHLQAKQREGHAERRAQVVYANLGRLKEPLTNELPGVFLIDVCSENIPVKLLPASPRVCGFTMEKHETTAQGKIILATFCFPNNYNFSVLVFLSTGTN